MKRKFPGHVLRWLMVRVVRQGDPGEEQSLGTSALQISAVLGFLVLFPVAIVALIVIIWRLSRYLLTQVSLN